MRLKFDSSEWEEYIRIIEQMYTFVMCSMDTRKVAVETLKRAEKGKACYTPGRFYLAYQAAGKILPHSLMMKLNRL